MSKEAIPLQIDLFTGELTDTRSTTQKRTDRGREQPQQTELFPQREVAQFGVRARPQLPLSAHTRLILIAEDPRSEEEKEQDRVREAERLTIQLFPECAPLPKKTGTEEVGRGIPLSPVPRSAPPIGFRKQMRHQLIPLKTRG